MNPGSSKIVFFGWITLGITLRMKKKATEKHDTKYNNIFSFFLYLLRKTKQRRTHT